MSTTPKSLRPGAAPLGDQLAQHLARDVHSREVHACVDQWKSDPPGPDPYLEARLTGRKLGGRKRDQLRHHIVRDRSGTVVVVRGPVEGDRFGQIVRPAPAQ